MLIRLAYANLFLLLLAQGWMGIANYMIVLHKSLCGGLRHLPIAPVANYMTNVI